jgi:hypothetical protein
MTDQPTTEDVLQALTPEQTATAIRGAQRRIEAAQEKIGRLGAGQLQVPPHAEVTACVNALLDHLRVTDDQLFLLRKALKLAELLEQLADHARVLDARMRIVAPGQTPRPGL